MNTRTTKLLSAGALCLMAVMPMARGDIQVVQCGLQYRITVDPGTVKARSSLVLVWDAKDHGETLDGWAGSCEVATINSNGGEFFKPIEDIPEGCVVRAFATRSGRLLKDDGYVELFGNQYFVTDVKENLASGMEMTFVMTDGWSWCPLIAGTHDGFTIGRNSISKNSVYVRCYDGDEIGVKPSFTEGGVTTISLRRGGNEGKTGVLRVNGTEVKAKNYSEPFVLCRIKNGQPTEELVHLGTSVNRENFTNCKWYSVKFWDLNGNLVRDYVPACVGETPCLYDTVNKTFLESEGTGSVSKSGDLGDLMLEIAASSPVAKTKGNIQVIRESNQYRIIVDPGTVNATASLMLAWDTEDRGRTLDGWTNTRYIADVNPNGGEFITPIEGIPAGSVVRAFATQSVSRLNDGGYVELSGNQYFVTDVKENGSSGMEMTFTMSAGGNWNTLLAGTLDGFTIGRNDASKNSVYVRCHDGDEIGVRPSFTEGGVTTISLRRGGNEGKTGVLRVDGTDVKTKDYSEPFVLYNKAQNIVHIGTSANRDRFTNCKWYSVKFWDLNGNLVRDYVPACVGETPCLYDTVSETCLESEGTGEASLSGTAGDPEVKVAAFSPPAELVDPKLVVKATWTGTAGDGALFNPGNWDCINLLDEKVGDGIPGALTDITLTGEIDMNIAEDQVLTGRSVTVNATLKRDVSWMGHIQTPTGVDVLPAGSFIEMNGHDLTLAGAYVATEKQWTIRNSAEGDPATLCIVTAEGQVNANRNTWLKGNLRLEKRGVGTYVAHTQTGNDGSDFTGGTYLVEGVTKLVDGTWWRAFGGDNRIIRIGPNATLDTTGTYHICNTPIYLDGGTILQSGQMTNQNGDSFGSITLTADSTFRATADTVINSSFAEGVEWAWAMSFIDLGGHTLTIDVADNCYLDIGKLDVANGLVKVVGNGKFRTDGRDYHRLNAPTADLDVEAQRIELFSDVTVRNFTCRATNAPEIGGDSKKSCTVSGTFRPITPNFTKVRLLDGATLSLVDQTGAWSVDSSAIAKQPEYRVVFPETGTIYVDVTGRTDIRELAKSPSPYLVKWHEGEVPTGVRFKIVGAPREGYGAIVDSTGLRLRSPGFLMVFR